MATIPHLRGEIPCQALCVSRRRKHQQPTGLACLAFKCEIRVMLMLVLAALNLCLLFNGLVAVATDENSGVLLLMFGLNEIKI